MRLNLESLVCDRVIDERRPGGSNESVRIGGDTVQVQRVEDVLYIPRLKLQVVEGRLVPLEATGYQWYLDLEKRITFGTHSAAPYRADFSVQDVQEDVCILSNFYSDTFAHSIDELFKVVALERFGFDGKYVFTDAPAYSREMLHLVGIEDCRIITTVTEPTVFNSVFYTTAMNRQDILEYPDFFFAVREALLSASPERSACGRRLWMQRGAGARTVRRNRLVDEAAVRDCLRHHGFDFVDPGSMSVSEQIGAFRNAEIISGPHGSSFIHAMFMNEESGVVECFSPNYVNPSIIEVCRLLKHYYYMVVDLNTQHWVYPHGQSLSVNCTHLSLVLEGLDRQLQRAQGRMNVFRKVGGYLSSGRGR